MAITLSFIAHAKCNRNYVNSKKEFNIPQILRLRVGFDFSP